MGVDSMYEWMFQMLTRLIFIFEVITCWIAGCKFTLTLCDVVECETLKITKSSAASTQSWPLQLKRDTTVVCSVSQRVFLLYDERVRFSATGVRPPCIVRNAPQIAASHVRPYTLDYSNGRP